MEKNSGRHLFWALIPAVTITAGVILVIEGKPIGLFILFLVLGAFLVTCVLVSLLWGVFLFPLMWVMSLLFDRGKGKKNQSPDREPR